MPANPEIWHLIDQKVVQWITSLNLSDNQGRDVSDRVYSHLTPGPQPGQGLTKTLPCIVVSEEGVREEQLGGDSENSEWLYSVLVHVEDNMPPARHDRKSLYMRWRKAIIDRFNKFDAAEFGVTCVQGCLVYPDVFVDTMLPVYQHVVSTVLLKFRTKEPRP